jgi:hypothetical protein
VEGLDGSQVAGHGERLGSRKLERGKIRGSVSAVKLGRSRSRFDANYALG